MLCELIVRNFAIIHELEIAFSPGLTIITGETGAGKSILVGAVNLVLGSRASQDMIRTGAQEATVEALFSLSDNSVLRKRLQEIGINVDEELIIRRHISRSGRNRIFVNGRRITLQELQGLARGLISISGQHEHQLLLDSEVHLSLLDRFGQLEEQTNEVHKAFRDWSHASHRLTKLRELKQELLRQRDFMQYQLNELQSAHLQTDEDLLLEEERKLLRHAATLHDAAESAYRMLYSGQESTLDKLNEVANHLAAIWEIDTQQRPLQEHLEQAQIHLEELAHSLQRYASRISFDPYRLAEIEDRMAVLQKLCKKYGGSVNDLIERTEELQAALSEQEDPAIQEQELEQRVEQSRIQYLDLAVALSRTRRDIAEQLSVEVERVLEQLDLAHARFRVSFHPEQLAQEIDPSLFSPQGIDQVEFLLSANPGEALKPLAKVASGGELSRILLALKSLLSTYDQSETLIFDEVDSGIGGRTAELVGRQIQRLANKHQVICITHLPQIACYGQHHLQVVKESDGKHTQALIRALSDAERVEELARMLGGITISSKTRAHAREWLETAKRDSGSG